MGTAFGAIGPELASANGRDAPVASTVQRYPRAKTTASQGAAIGWLIPAT